MEENEVVDSGTEAKTYTDKDLQSYADKRVSEALKTARSKFEAEKKEAERLASMSAEERFNEEISKREKELTDREKQVTLLENKQSATAILNEKGLSINLVDLVVADTAEDMKSRIDILEKEFNASVKAEVEKRLKGSTPSLVSPDDGITKDDISKMSIKQQQQLFESQPDLFKKLYERG